jgi:membrane protease YdiL (CAAX protease family)
MRVSAATQGAGIGSSSARPVAAGWHTVALIVALTALSVVGAVRSPIAEWAHTLATPRDRILFYAQVILIQWAYVAYVCVGLWRMQTSIRSLIDSSRLTVWRYLRYLAVGIAAWIFWLAAGAGLGIILRPSPEDLAGVMAMLPKTPPESGVWIAFALTAGIVEEFVYRGYLFRQFQAWTGSVAVAVALQAVVYATAHVALPVEMVISAGLMGLLLGAMAVWQKSLVPGMIMHVAVGLVAMLGAAA